MGTLNSKNHQGGAPPHNPIAEYRHDNRLTFMTFMTCLLFFLFLLPSSEAQRIDNKRETVMFSNVCMSTTPIIWEKDPTYGSFGLRSQNLQKVLNPCATSHQQYVMMPIDLVDHQTDDFKRNILVYNRHTNQLVRYDPVAYGEQTSLKENVLDNTLKKESDLLGINYEKESYDGIPGIPGIHKDFFDVVMYSQVGRHDPTYKSVFPESTNYLDILPKEAYKKAFEFLDQDSEINFVLKDLDPDEEDIQEVAGIVKNMDHLIQNAPRLKHDVVLLKGVPAYNKLWHREIGSTIIDPTFQFVTSAPNIAKNYGAITLVIKVPKGTPILAWEYLSDNPHFHEVILPR